MLITRLGEYESAKFPLPTVSRFRNGTLSGLGQAVQVDAGSIASSLTSGWTPYLIGGIVLGLLLAPGISRARRSIGKLGAGGGLGGTNITALLLLVLAGGAAYYYLKQQGGLSA